MAELLTLAEAQRAVLAHVRPLASERVATAGAAGRVLSEPGVAVVDLPPFDSSAMDGYAVRAADTPGALPVSLEVAAGQPASRALRPGEAFGISTGGAVPAGSDAVVPVEYVVRHGNKIEIPNAVRRGANVRPQGGDIRRGETIIPAGVRLTPAALGALAAAGVAEVACGRRPRAAVLTTGSELELPGVPLRPGRVYEANGVMLAAGLAAAGAVVERLPAVSDDEAAHRAALERGLESDLLVTSGGVSVGPHDLVRGVAAALGVEEVFWGVAVKPGKPLSFGMRRSTLVFGLPGNPVSALVGFELFVRPAVLALQGLPEPLPERELGRLTRPLRRNARRDELVRARRRSGPVGTTVEPLAGQESHMIARAASADVLVFVPRGEGELGAGELVELLRLDR